MSSFNDLVEDVLGTMRGFVAYQEQSTHVAGAVSDSDLQWTVGDASRISPGRAECGNEIIYVDSVDAASNVITVAPYGRGMDGSGLEAHALNAQVVNNPQWPRVRVKRAINDTILSTSGVLFAVDNEVFSTEQAQTAYELPAEALSVLNVKIETSDSTWIDLREWRLDNAASTSDFSTQKALVTGNLPGDRALEATYTKDPGVLSGDGDSFGDVTGLPESCRDVVALGAAWRLTSTIGPGMFNSRSVASADLDQKRSDQMPNQESLQMYRMFQQRLNEERLKLLERHPSPIHHTRF